MDRAELPEFVARDSASALSIPRKRCTGSPVESRLLQMHPGRAPLAESETAGAAPWKGWRCRRRPRACREHTCRCQDANDPEVRTARRPRRDSPRPEPGIQLAKELLLPLSTRIENQDTMPEARSRSGEGPDFSGREGVAGFPHLAVVDPLTTEPAHICVERVRGRVGGRLSPENCAQPFKLIRQRKNHSALAYVNLEPPQIFLVQSRIFTVLECNAQGGI